MGMSVNAASHHDTIFRVNDLRGADGRIGDFPVPDVDIPPDKPLPVKRVNDSSVFYQQSIHRGRQFSLSENLHPLDESFA
jgi:hypothetical protein